MVQTILILNVGIAALLLFGFAMAILTIATLVIELQAGIRSKTAMVRIVLSK